MQSICEKCGFVGEAQKRRPGSYKVQVALLIAGLLTMGVVLIAWLGYGLWRLLKTEEVCPSCGQAKTMISLASPLGQKLKVQFEGGAPLASATSASLGSTDEVRACPYCAETIRKAAKLCRYCGKELSAA